MANPVAVLYACRSSGAPVFGGRFAKNVTPGRASIALAGGRPVVSQSAGVTQQNVALASNGAIASASSTYSNLYPVSSVNDGGRVGTGWGNGAVGGGWNDATGGVFPDWVRIKFASYKTIDRVIVYTLGDGAPGSLTEPTDSTTFTQNGIVDFQVQAWNGTAWVALATITGNNLVKRTVTFAPYSTTDIRIYVTNALLSYSRIVEIEAFGVDATGTAPPGPDDVSGGGGPPPPGTINGLEVAYIDGNGTEQKVGTFTLHRDRQYRAPITGNPHLVAWVELINSATGYLVWIENGHLRDAAQVTYDGQMVLRVLGTERQRYNFSIITYGRRYFWPEPINAGTNAAIPARQTASPLNELEYSTTVPNATTMLAGYNWIIDSVYDPMWQGDWPTAMGAAGASSHIGPRPLWDLLDCIVKSDRSAILVLKMAFWSGRYSIHPRDPTTHDIINFVDYPYASFDQSSHGDFLPYPGNAPQWDPPHEPEIGARAFEVFGYSSMADVVGFVATTNYLFQVDSKRDYQAGVLPTYSGSNTTRGAGWTIARLARAALIFGAHSQFATSLSYNFSWYWWFNPHNTPNNPQGICNPYSYANYLPMTGQYWHSIWMEDFLTFGFGFGLEVLVHLGIDLANDHAFFDWKARSTTFRLGRPDHSDEFDYRLAVNYILPIAPAPYHLNSTGNPSELYFDIRSVEHPDWFGFYDMPDWWGGTGPWFTDRQIQQASGATANSGDTIAIWHNYPDMGSYPGNFMIGLYYAVRFNTPGARAAAARLMADPGWQGLLDSAQSSPIFALTITTAMLTAAVPVYTAPSTAAPSFIGPDIPTISGTNNVAITPFNVASRFTVEATPGTFSKSPAGTTWPTELTISNAGLVSGTPVAGTTNGVRVRVTDAIGRTADSTALNIVIAATAPAPPPPPPPPAGSPEWYVTLNALADGTWMEIPGSALTVYPATGFEQAADPKNRVDCWNGYAMDPATGVLRGLGNGGHADYQGNEIIENNLRRTGVSVFPWVMRRQPTIASLAPLYAVPHNLEGRKPSSHTYWQSFDPGNGYAYNLGLMAVWGSGNEGSIHSLHKFDIAANDWVGGGTYPNNAFADIFLDAFTTGGMAMHPITKKIYYQSWQWGNCKDFDPASNIITWHANWPAGNILTDYACGAVDSIRNQIVWFGNNNIDGWAATYNINTDVASAFPFTGPAANVFTIAYSQGNSNGRNGYCAHHDRTIDRFVIKTKKAGELILMRPPGGGPAGETGYVERFNALGGSSMFELPGIHIVANRFLPMIMGDGRTVYVYHPHADSNIWAIRLPLSV